MMIERESYWKSISVNENVIPTSFFLYAQISKEFEIGKDIIMKKIDIIESYESEERHNNLKLLAKTKGRLFLSCL